MISPHIPPVSRPWRVHVHLNLSFPLSIAKAMAFGPALRPAAPVRCHHGPGQPLGRFTASPSPGYW